MNDRKGPDKRRYTAPRLVKYGAVKDLTQARDMGARSDGVQKGMGNEFFKTG